MSIWIIKIVQNSTPSKHSKLIQRWYMLKQRHHVDQRDIHVDATSICQCWFIDKIQRWNNVDFGLTLKTVFVVTLKR